MKTTVIISTISMVYLYSINPIYPIFWFTALVVGAIFYYKYLERKKEIEKLEWYRTNLKNIIEVTNSPKDIDELPRCREHIEWLIKSKNMLRGKVKAVKVYAVIWKSLDVMCFYLDEKNGKTVIAKERINVDKEGVNETEDFYSTETEIEGIITKSYSYQTRVEEFKKQYAQKRATEIRFHITDKEIEDADEKSGLFHDQKFLGKNPF